MAWQYVSQRRNIKTKAKKKHATQETENTKHESTGGKAGTLRRKGGGDWVNICVFVSAFFSLSFSLFVRFFFAFFGPRFSAVSPVFAESQKSHFPQEKSEKKAKKKQKKSEKKAKKKRNKSEKKAKKMRKKCEQKVKKKSGKKATNKTER